MTDNTCIECGRGRKPKTGSKSRQLCSSCYSVWYRQNRKRTKACAWCGGDFQTARAAVVYCGASCAGKYANSSTEGSPGWVAYQARVQAEKKPTQPKKTPTELQALWRSQRSPLRASYEEARWSDFIAALRERVAVTTGGCWIWGGTKSLSKKSSSPYPVIRWSGKTHQVHRLSLEAKHGQSLGSQQSHHACGNTMCVNPSHLQAATHIENIAEMKARHSYEARIHELENVVRGIDANHPILDRVRCGIA